jgi:hypothetical protein
MRMSGAHNCESTLAVPLTTNPLGEHRSGVYRIPVRASAAPFSIRRARRSAPRSGRGLYRQHFDHPRGAQHHHVDQAVRSTRHRLGSTPQNFYVYDETIRFNLLIVDRALCVVLPYLPQACGVDSPTFVIKDNTASEELFSSSTRCSGICGSGANPYDHRRPNASPDRRPRRVDHQRDHPNQGTWGHHGQERPGHGDRGGLRGRARRTGILVS